MFFLSFWVLNSHKTSECCDLCSSAGSGCEIATNESSYTITKGNVANRGWVFLILPDHSAQHKSPPPKKCSSTSWRCFRTLDSPCRGAPTCDTRSPALPRARRAWKARTLFLGAFSGAERGGNASGCWQAPSGRAGCTWQWNIYPKPVGWDVMATMLVVSQWQKEF